MEPEEKAREGTWARPVDRLTVANRPPSQAINLNVNGRELTGPLQGFGQMWQKSYTVRLSGTAVQPHEVIAAWKANFGSFWPQGNRFYGSLQGITPGDVAVLNLAAPGGLPLSTGVLVIYADDSSFSFMTPQGHMFAGLITFSAYEEDGTTEAEVRALIRASDPIYELGCRLGIVHRMEDTFWRQTLERLAAHFGVNGQVQMQTSRVDDKVQWRQAGNVWHNAAIRSALYAPVQALRLFLRRQG